MESGMISAILEQFGSILVEELKQRGRLVVGAESDVKQMTGTLKAIQALLKDAEQRQLTEETVKRWICDLKDVSFEIDDVLDEWSTAIHQRRVEGNQPNLSWLELMLLRVSNFFQRVCPFFPFLFVSFDDVSLRHDIASKLKELKEKLDDIDEDRTRFGFSVSAADATDVGRVRKIITSGVLNTEMKGRDAEKADLMKMLLCEGSSSSEVPAIQVISIIGMGGLGKTTLAKSVYKDAAGHFGKLIWVCVLDPFDEMRIAKAILESLLGQKSELVELSAILEEIYSRVSELKYFLVLDDVWEADFSKWEELLGSLGSGKPGSRIMVTTRKKSVAAALLCSEANMLQLQPLSEQACWMVFERQAFLGWDRKDCELVEDYGKEIVRQKCNGLPLTAKALGSLLRLKKSRRQWKSVLESEVWKLEETMDLDLFAPLWLSYYDLSAELKQCFAFCSVFPKGFVIEKDKLIRLWMAQGYLGATSNMEVLELKGENYFETLVMRSFFQDLGADDELLGSGVTCTMHGLVQDFARFVSSDKYYRVMTCEMGQSKLDSMSQKMRHLTLLPNLESELPCCIRLKKLKLTLFKCTHPPISHAGDILPNVTSQLTSLSGCGVQRIPDAISMLLHLRLLDLSHNNDLQCLPEELCDLHNLQTLDVSYCGYLNTMPVRMDKLVNLKYLFNHKAKWARFPRGIGKLLELRTMPEFNLFENPDAASLGDLRNLNQLRGSLKINRLGNSPDHVNEANSAQLEKKKHVTCLKLEFGFEEEPVEWRIAQDEKLIEALKPSENLEELTMMYYQGATLSPSWMPLLTNLTRLALVQCMNCVRLPALGKLASLEYLELNDFPVTKVGDEEFLGGLCIAAAAAAFPKLTELRISHFEEWEEWVYEDDSNVDEVMMPRLRRVELQCCESLKKLPDQLVKKTTLKELKLQWCDSLTDWYKQAEEWAKIAHIPIVTIL